MPQIKLHSITNITHKINEEYKSKYLNKDKKYYGYSYFLVLVKCKTTLQLTVNFGSECGKYQNMWKTNNNLLNGKKPSYIHIKERIKIKTI